MGGVFGATDLVGGALGGVFGATDIEALCLCLDRAICLASFDARAAFSSMTAGTSFGGGARGTAAGLEAKAGAIDGWAKLGIDGLRARFCKPM